MFSGQTFGILLFHFIFTEAFISFVLSTPHQNEHRKFFEPLCGDIFLEKWKRMCKALINLVKIVISSASDDVFHVGP
ncbi:CLUMA_CG009726, isoform A [Clunio marinus]|uniref:CLUMA_CG009726, isoform A n=1 Tax=Clunio marinus TaxID=568069 RepID=A0A1J1I7Y8_9DIPT|nr:CLUMA_CG009726, isoform A [Clunio marinus]